MNAFKTTALIAAALLATAGCQKPPEDTTADEAQLKTMAPAWAEAYNAGNVDALVGMYWENAVLLPPGAPAAEGRDAIRAYLAGDVAGSKAAGVRLNIPAAGSVDVSGDLGYEAGTFTVTNVTGATVDTGKFLGVLQKRDGKWLYIRDTWNSDHLPTPAASEAAGDCCEQAAPGAAAEAAPASPGAPASPPPQ